MLKGLFLNNSSQSGLALQDIAIPIIGVTVIILIVVVLAVLLFKWYQFMVKRGVEKYVEKHGGAPPEED